MRETIAPIRATLHTPQSRAICPHCGAAQWTYRTVGGTPYFAEHKANGLRCVGSHERASGVEDQSTP
jgi:hypothetical protein